MKKKSEEMRKTLSRFETETTPASLAYMAEARTCSRIFLISKEVRIKIVGLLIKALYGG
jgi:hypothetical protein